MAAFAADADASDAFVVAIPACVVAVAAEPDAEVADADAADSALAAAVALVLASWAYFLAP